MGNRALLPFNVRVGRDHRYPKRHILPSVLVDQPSRNGISPDQIHPGIAAQRLFSSARVQTIILPNRAISLWHLEFLRRAVAFVNVPWHNSCTAGKKYDQAVLAISGFGIGSFCALWLARCQNDNTCCRPRHRRIVRHRGGNNSFLVIHCGNVGGCRVARWFRLQPCQPKRSSDDRRSDQLENAHVYPTTYRPEECRIC